MSRTVAEIRAEMKEVGRIIDYRSLCNIPLWAYVKEYGELKEELRVAEGRVTE